MTESDRLGGISLSFPANEEDNVTTSSPKTLPRRLRRRLLEPKSPVSAEEIDSKLKEADLRRQVNLKVCEFEARWIEPNRFMEIVMRKKSLLYEFL